jgi:MoaA/NifB/PqqE/SkfB family radical SAM enzyme
VQKLELLWIELTGLCNLSCIHCYANSGPNNRDKHQINKDECIDIVSQAADLGCRRVQFIGGEPTVVPYLAELVDHAWNCKIPSIEVFTNATRISNALIETLKRCNASVAVSFYSWDVDIHDDITRMKGSHRATVVGLRSLLSAGISVSASIIAMERNARGVEKTTDFLLELGVLDVFVDDARALGRGINIAAPTANRLCGKCGHERIAILANGEVSPCVMSRTSVIGNIRKQKLTDILTGHALLKFCEQATTDENGVKAHRVHSLNLAATTPDKDAPDPDVQPLSPQCSPNKGTPDKAPPEIEPLSPQCSPNKGTPEKAPPDIERSPQCSPNRVGTKISDDFVTVCAD